MGNRYDSKLQNSKYLNDSKLQKCFDSQENSETKILNETDITFSEKKFGPSKNNYKKVLGLEWDI